MPQSRTVDAETKPTRTSDDYARLYDQEHERPVSWTTRLMELAARLGMLSPLESKRRGETPERAPSE